ncbi:MAG: nucleotidyltransferase domain-containing protein [Chitinophaga sp.]|uniref:nucleotidyltransferase domain-containing protein n=1 Tax=Chitinophaga sp. TaxID=1869181 RepID=UPI0025BB686E|nr:nucleotidyltransferase domain-containing protein [Chitinophaga sp.]MBV8253590.1 nucleotidyltransferase domain-containing protein [Chitinophaga sp.]
MREIILEKLAAIEAEKNVRILMAIESGSRAWGFASPDSDFDVRFIYAQPENNYLSIRDRKDVIDIPVNEVLDINGWDLRKALRLFMNSNSPLYEWLQSGIIYKEETALAATLRAQMNDYYSHQAGCHHYFSMTNNTLQQNLQDAEVKLKKYFYALRPALAGMWIIERKTVPPMDFHQLRTLVTDSAWNHAVDQLLEQKKTADEKTLIAPVPFLQQWISEVLDKYMPLANALPTVHHDADKLDEVFRKFIRA